VLRTARTLNPRGIKLALAAGPPGRGRRAQDGALLVVHDRGVVVWRIALR
jgi:hypothetical protein